MKTAVVGESFPEKKTADGAQYYLKPIIQDMEFELSIYIPDDFEVPVTDFELWVNNILIGERTPKDKKLRHLGLDMDKTEKVIIRLYNGEDFIDDVKIDPDEESGPLPITSGYEIKKIEPDELGTYELSAPDSTGMVKLSIKPESPEVKTWIVKNKEGVPVGTKDPIAIDKQLTYLSLFSVSLTDVTVELYGEDGGLIDTGRFNESNAKILRVTQE